MGLIGCFSLADSNVVELGGPTMGTEWRISLGTQNAAQSELIATDSALRQAIVSGVETELVRINQLMSTWDPKSELSLFNTNLTTEHIRWHSDALKVLQTALDVSRATNGSYDVTRGRVFELWGFSANAADVSAPSAAQLDLALSTSGWRAVNVGSGGVAKRHSDLAIDLSSLAKGFAVDQLGAVLESFGMQHYVVTVSYTHLTLPTKA